jgi:futalosine hydrolase
VRILIVTATTGEIAPLVARLQPAAEAGPRLSGYIFGAHAVDVLTTGVGMVATAAWCSRTLMGGEYDMALNVGVCGTFDRALAPSSVVHVVSDRLPELGAEDGDNWLSIHDLGLLGDNEFPFHAGELRNLAPPDNAALRALPEASGITVNAVHGNDASIARVLERFVPRVESMEGAAFMYACLVHGLPFAQVRAVSNVVERRNRAAWKMPEAVAALNASALDILDQL